MLEPGRPGSSVAIYFVLENGQDYYLGRNDDADAIGVRALDDRTVEFRLVAPAPYFMSVMNRPDGGPQPRHAIERDGARGRDRSAGRERRRSAIVERTDDLLVLERRDASRSAGRATCAGSSSSVRRSRTRCRTYERGELDMITVRYTPRLADLMPGAVHAGRAASARRRGRPTSRFDHSHPAMSNVHLRRALAHAIDREALAAAAPANLVVATGGVVPPALQGHTPDIALRYDPDLARELLAQSGFDGELELAGMMVWEDDPRRDRARLWRTCSAIGCDVATGRGAEEAMQRRPSRRARAMRVTGWFPGYADPEYFLRLLFHSDSRTNEGGFSQRGRSTT